MSQFMRNAGGGFSGSHRSAYAQQSAGAAAWADFQDGLSKPPSKITGELQGMLEGTEKARRQRELGRLGAYGVPGKVPKIPWSSTKGLRRMMGPFATPFDLLDGIEALNEWYNREPAVAPHYDLPSNWVRCSAPMCTPDKTPLAWEWWSASNAAGTCSPFGPCPILQVSVINNPLGDTTGFPANTASVVFGQQNVSNPTRYDFHAHFRRTTPYAGGVQVYPAWNPGGDAIAGPLPGQDRPPAPKHREKSQPRAMGRQQAAKTAAGALNVLMPAPGLIPPGGDTGGAGSSGDWSPEPADPTDPEPWNPPLPDIDPETPPYEEPGVTVIVGPGGAGLAPPSIHQKLRPNKKVKEVKWKIPHSKLGDFYGALTELKDFLEAMNEAIPGNPCSGMGLHAQLACVVRNIHKADPRTAFSEFAKNQLEDFVIGKSNQLANQITKSPYWKRPVGQGFGGFSHRMR